MIGRRLARDRDGPGVGEILVEFYGQPHARAALAVTSALLTFGGGAAMFWVHAVWRGEAGPAIAHVFHWLLDSTLGCVALTPVLAFLLPLGVRAAGRSRRALGAYVLTVAVVFTVVTGPGPFLHNQVAGAGTPLAEAATRFFGRNAQVAAANAMVHERSSLSEGFVQVAIGLPVYMVLTWLSMAMVRVGFRRRRPATAAATARPWEP